MPRVRADSIGLRRGGRRPEIIEPVLNRVQAPPSRRLSAERLQSPLESRLPDPTGSPASTRRTIRTEGAETELGIPVDQIGIVNASE